MEHARKMMLVDATDDLRNVRKHHTALDRNISDVLGRQDLDDYLKVKLYQDALNKFLVSRQTVEDQFQSPLKVQVTEPKSTTSIEDKFLEGLTVENREKASNIISDTLSNTPLRWDKSGRILDGDGRPIEGSNIGDIVLHKIKPPKRSATKPVGYETFAQYDRAPTPPPPRPPSPPKIRRKQRDKKKRKSLNLSWLYY
jgi:hypothetical protein